MVANTHRVVAAPSTSTPRLVLRFAVYAGVALVLAVGAGLLLVRHNATQRAQDRLRVEAASVSTRLGQDDLARGAFNWPRPSTAAADDLQTFLDDFFDPVLLTGDLHVTLFAPDGTVTYSRDRSLVGSMGDPAMLRRALAGRSAVRTTQEPSLGKQLESWVPVYWKLAPDRPRGVLRVSRDYGPVASEIRQDFYVHAGALTLTLLLLYLALVPIMRRVTRALVRTLAERERLAAIVETSNDAIVGKSLDGIVWTWNRGAQEIYGYTAEEIVGRSIYMLLPSGRDDVEAPPEQRQHDDLVRSVHVRKDGELIDVSVTISPIRDAKGTLIGASMIARDVTELKHLEEELREAHRQEAIGKLATGIARDVESLLARIEDAATRALLRMRGDRDIEEIRRTTAQGVALTTQLLAIGGAQPADPRVLDVNETLRGIVTELRGLIADDVRLVADLADDLGYARADPRQIEQVVLNLATNARDAMPAGGTLTIKTENVDFTRRTERRPTARIDPGHYVMIAIGDTGPELDRAARERPFEPYVKIEESGERMALGLAAVAGIVRQSGGSMGLESEPGAGTTVRIYLPRVSDVPQPTELRPATPTA